MKSGLKIRDLRNQRNWTIACVANQVGTDHSTIQKIETCSRKPSYELLIKLLNLFDKTEIANALTDLFGE